MSERVAGPDPRSAGPWAVVARMTVKEGRQEEWLSLVNEVMNTMRHERTFVSTSMCVHATDPHKFMHFEVWESREEFFGVQVHRDYRKALMEKLPSLLEEPATFEEWVETRADYAVHVRR